MKKTVMNAVTGEQKLVDLEPEEVAAIEAKAAARVEEPKPLTVVDRIIADAAELAKLKAALGLV
ncbi:MAG: hypothetical protein KBE22_16235 [Candidatus Accumulibacter sp.]|nr:hypothetical protein [Accumulibacter sp.]